MEKILTIAIPVYNMEQYLRRCLDSVVASKYIDRLEILVVNDGSKDRSLEIAREYESKYPDSVRAIDKPNGGWGSAINLSIREAKGKYYKSLDSDDWFDTEELDGFIEELTAVDADLVVTNLTEVDADNNCKPIEFNSLYGVGNLPIVDFLIKGNYTFDIPIHSDTYRTEFLQSNNIAVSECFYADQDFKVYPVAHIRTINFSRKNVYRYFYGREGQSVSYAGYVKHYGDYVRVCKAQLKFYKDAVHTLDKDIKKVLENKIFEHCKWAYALALDPKICNGSAEAQNALKELDECIKLSSTSLYKRLASVKTMKIMPYIFLWRKCNINFLKVTDFFHR